MDRMRKIDEAIAKVQKARKKARSLTRHMKALGLSEEELNELFSKPGATEEEVMQAIDKAMKCAKQVRDRVC